MEDPFYAVRDDLSAALAGARSQLARWRGLARTAGKDAARAAAELRAALADIDADVAELEQAVAVAARDPARFRLAAAEVAGRREFVAAARKEAAALRAALADEEGAAQAAQRDMLLAGGAKGGQGAAGGSSDRTARPPRAPNGTPLPADGRSPASLPSSGSPAPAGSPPGPSVGAPPPRTKPAGAPRPGTPSGQAGRSSTPDTGDRPRDRFAENEQMQQQVIMREQDRELDQVAHTVRNLREIAVTIGDEVEDQKVLLDDVDERVDRTQGRMQLAQKRMNAVLAELRKGGTCTIVCLITVLLILLVVVIVI
ncbi:syntaxin 6, N-terminal-domain-containing protein [Hyaloraphidium curvatum]|nr:syntaxin 6, N-terminal-domain-containing protein [Hyaloraphidium curvatum]